MLNEDQLAKLRTAGKVAGAARELGLSMVKEGVKLYDVAQEVEGYIREHGCGLAFPCNISINEIAAHYTPSCTDKSVFQVGDVVKVKDGYGRNFLIPTGRAKRATKAAIAEFEARRAELEAAQAERIAAAQKIADTINEGEIEISSKCGVDGRLFGSVTNADIAEAIDAKYGLQIKKSQVRTPLGAIKAVGDYVITIGLLTDITADVTVHVVGEA